MSRTKRDEAGNVIVIIGVIMVLTLLSIAVVARTMAGLKSTKQGQDFSGALAQADAGLSDALFRFDQMGVAPATNFCVGPNPACTVQSVPGAPDIEYTAHRVDDNTYTVMSKGIVNGQPHAIRATVTRGFLYPFAIFAKTGINFNGNSGNYAPPCSPPTGCPVETVDANGNFVSSPAADVASNGLITCTGAPSPAHQQDFFQGGGTNCNNGYLKPGSYDPLNPQLNCPTAPNIPTTPCLPASYQPCPANPATGMLPPVLLGGVYYCNQNDLIGTTTIQFPPGFQVAPGGPNNGVVELYVIPTDNPPTSITVSIADTGCQPNMVDPCPLGVNNAANGAGDPTKLRVYLAGGKVDPGGGSHSGDFTGIMYAPTAAEVNPSCYANWRGGLIVNTFTCNGGTHLSVKYDTRMETLTEVSWTVTNYTEIPSSQVTLP
jgi:hypothetical protein